MFVRTMIFMFIPMQVAFAAQHLTPGVLCEHGVGENAETILDSSQITGKLPGLFRPAPAQNLKFISAKGRHYALMQTESRLHVIDLGDFKTRTLKVGVFGGHHPTSAALSLFDRPMAVLQTKSVDRVDHTIFRFQFLDLLNFSKIEVITRSENWNLRQYPQNLQITDALVVARQLAAELKIGEVTPGVLTETVKTLHGAFSPSKVILSNSLGHFALELNGDDRRHPGSNIEYGQFVFMNLETHFKETISLPSDRYSARWTLTQKDPSWILSTAFSHSGPVLHATSFTDRRVQTVDLPSRYEVIGQKQTKESTAVYLRMGSQLLVAHFPGGIGGGTYQFHGPYQLEGIGPETINVDSESERVIIKTSNGDGTIRLYVVDPSKTFEPQFLTEVSKDDFTFVATSDRLLVSDAAVQAATSHTIAEYPTGRRYSLPPLASSKVPGRIGLTLIGDRPHAFMVHGRLMRLINLDSGSQVESRAESDLED